jgi:hypothetical protein
LMRFPETPVSVRWFNIVKRATALYSSISRIRPYIRFR